MTNLKPFVKWAGGKRQIITQITNLIKECEKEKEIKNYTFIEPFVGGGVVFLSLKKPNVIINDLNRELIISYQAIRDNPEELMEKLDESYKKFKQDGQTYFYEVRQQDKDLDFYTKSNIEIAQRMIFLNKTCFNGLYRVNSEGYFNTPIGRNKMTSFYERNNIINISNYLKNNDIKILNGSYDVVSDLVKAGDIIYIDPPYDYKKDDGFTKYQKDGFNFSDFKKLKEWCDDCLEKGAFVILSNNDTPKVRSLFIGDRNHSYYSYEINPVKTKRCINCKGNLRNTGEEVLIVGKPNKFPKAISPDTLIELIKKRSSIKKYETMSESYRKKHSKHLFYDAIDCLKFFKILDNENELTSNGELIRSSPDSEMTLANIVSKTRIIGDVYKESIIRKKPLSSTEIAEFLISNSVFSSEYANKKSKSIQKWVDWSFNEVN